MIASPSFLFFWHCFLSSFPYLKQLIEEGAVMDHRFAQLLGVGFAALIAHRDGLRRSVMCYDLGVINRNVSRTALKISHRVATLQHQLTYQLVGLGDRALGVIDEAALQILPGLTEPGGFSRRQRYNIEVQPTLLL